LTCIKRQGGHFGEWEEPQAVAEDINAFFGELSAKS
jgi:hypothetical protein